MKDVRYEIRAGRRVARRWNGTESSILAIVLSASARHGNNQIMAKAEGLVPTSSTFADVTIEQGGRTAGMVPRNPKSETRNSKHAP